MNGLNLFRMGIEEYEENRRNKKRDKFKKKKGWPYKHKSLRDVKEVK